MGGGSSGAGSQASACINPVLAEGDSFSSSPWADQAAGDLLWARPGSALVLLVCIIRPPYPPAACALLTPSAFCAQLHPPGSPLPPTPQLSRSPSSPWNRSPRDASVATAATRPDVLWNTRNTCVTGTTIQCSRALTMCSTVVEEFQKPAFSFGGRWVQFD